MKNETETQNPKEKSKRRLRLLIQILANLLILTGVLYLFFWSYPLIAAHISYYYYRWKEVKYDIVNEPEELQNNPQTQSLSSLLEKPKEPLKVSPASTDFGIIIEKINVNVPVIANVSPADEEEYSEALNEGVAHTQGTKFPGQNGNCFLFSHSTFNILDIGRFNAVFTLLDKLETDDRIVTFYQGERFDYKVFEKKIVSPEDTSLLTAQYENPTLTLQTCHPPGTSLKRLIILASLEE